MPKINLDKLKAHLAGGVAVMPALDPADELQLYELNLQDIPDGQHRAPLVTTRIRDLGRSMREWKARVVASGRVPGVMTVAPDGAQHILFVCDAQPIDSSMLERVNDMNQALVDVAQHFNRLVPALARAGIIGS